MIKYVSRRGRILRGRVVAAKLEMGVCLVRHKRWLVWVTHTDMAKASGL